MHLACKMTGSMVKLMIYESHFHLNSLYNWSIKWSLNASLENSRIILYKLEFEDGLKPGVEKECTHCYKARSSENLEMKAFEKFENAVFFKIFKIPSDRQLILV